MSIKSLEEPNIMTDRNSEESWKLRVERRLAANRAALESIDSQMQQELARAFSERKHFLLSFLAVERRYYRGLINELQELL